jgi:outer membrane putative beta-barrel porin/alpha-amylase
MRFHIAALCAIVACCRAAHPACAEEKDTRLAKGVQDNSFLIEEAYNQEAGVVQHITSLRRQGHDWTFTFTQEWPLGSQTHQFSYTVPYLWLKRNQGHVQGFGDLMLNYRYQALMETSTLPAFAPRLSLILPTGDRDKDTGNDSLGYQVGLPFSKIVSDRVTLHANAGLTSYFDVAGRQPTSYSLGGSAILALTRETNLMFETVAEWNESVDLTGSIEREFALTILPGIRHAFNLPDDAQLVVGLGAPITFSQGQREYGVFLYLSLEHKFGR